MIQPLPLKSCPLPELGEKLDGQNIMMIEQKSAHGSFQAKIIFEFKVCNPGKNSNRQEYLRSYSDKNYTLYQNYPI
jgi:hypothetical protein